MSKCGVQIHLTSLRVLLSTSKTSNNVETHEIGKTSGTSLLYFSSHKGIVTNNRIVHKPPNADKQSQTTVLFCAQTAYLHLRDQSFGTRVKRVKGKRHAQT
jgi:hypothetical protein